METTLQQFYFQFIMAGAKSSANCHLLHHGEELLHLAWHQGVWASLEFLEEVGVVNQNL